MLLQWLKTVHGMLTIIAALLAIMAHLVAARAAAGGVFARAGAGPGRALVCRKEGGYILYYYSGGFSWYLYGPTLGRVWGYLVGTYDKDAGPDNQRLYLNGMCVVQTSDTQRIELNSGALGIGVPLLLFNQTSSESPVGPSAIPFVLSRRS